AAAHRAAELRLLGRGGAGGAAPHRRAPGDRRRPRRAHAARRPHAGRRRAGSRSRRRQPCARMNEITPEERVWRLIRGGLTARATALAAELGVADALSDGPRPLTEVAHDVGADPDTLYRLMRALAGDGVFAEEEPGVFRNTEASELLRRGNGWSDFAHLFGGVFYRAAADLDAS